LRRAAIDRRTSETRVKVRVNLDGRGRYDVRTGIRFLDHMLGSPRGSGSIDCRRPGDLDVDGHHTVDVGIALGKRGARADQARHQTRRLLRDAHGRRGGAAVDCPAGPCRIDPFAVGAWATFRPSWHDFFEGFAGGRANVHLKVPTAVEPSGRGHLQARARPRGVRRDGADAVDERKDFCNRGHDRDRTHRLRRCNLTSISITDRGMSAWPPRRQIRAAWASSSGVGNFAATVAGGEWRDVIHRAIAARLPVPARPTASRRQADGQPGPACFRATDWAGWRQGPHVGWNTPGGASDRAPSGLTSGVHAYTHSSLRRLAAHDADDHVSFAPR
jgi:imidazoleglycerol-phosphate dehydratase